MAWLSVLLALAASVSPDDAAACHTQQPAPPLEARQSPLAGYVALTDEALARLLVGRTLRDFSRSPSNITDRDYLETFMPHGVWLSFGGRGAGNSGSYDIHDGLICVVRFQGSQPQCRAIWRNAKGQYLSTDAGPDIFAIKRVVIESPGQGVPFGSGRPICE
jgi:hypothetical protein